MLPAIAILIERAKNYPEEFIEGKLGKMGKWDDLINAFSPCMTQEEREGLNLAIVNAKREMFNEAVMRRLASADMADEAKREVLGTRPSKIMTSASITEEALKILNKELNAKFSEAYKYESLKDSYTYTGGGAK